MAAESGKSKVGTCESGHRTDALGVFASNGFVINPLITKGLRTMLTKGMKCELSKSYVWAQIIRTVQVIL